MCTILETKDPWMIFWSPLSFRMLEKVIYSTQAFNFTFLLFIRAIFFFFFEGFVMIAVFF